MARPHDIGGMEGFGSVPFIEPEQPFAADWEARVLALASALSRQGFYDNDHFRDAIERMPAERYLVSSYYERYISAICTVLVDRGLVDRARIAELAIDG